MPVNVRQAAIDAVLPDRQSSMVDTQKVENRCVDVINLCGVLSIQGLVAKRIAGPVASPASDPPPTQPIGEAIRVVVPPPAPLRTGHAPKFSRPENDRVLEHPSLLEVLDQRRSPACHAASQRSMVALDVLVRIPVAPWKPLSFPDQI